MITKGADLLNGRFGQIVLRKRGKARLILGRILLSKYARINKRMLDGQWAPLSPAVGHSVSMTSWSARADSLIYALLSLLCQKPVRPRKIIVWLAER